MDTLMIGLASMKIFDGWGLQEILDYRRTILIQGCVIVPIAALWALATVLFVPMSMLWLLLLAIPILAVSWWLMQLSCLSEIAECRRTGKSSDQRRREARAKAREKGTPLMMDIPYD